MAGQRKNPEIKGFQAKRKERQFYQNYRSFMVEARRVEVPQAALRAHGCPHSLPASPEPLGDDKELNSPPLYLPNKNDPLL